MLNGTPLSDVEVAFGSENSEGGRVHVVAMTDASGCFRLPSDHSGPTVGTYRVTLRDFKYSAMLTEYQRDNPTSDKIPPEIIKAINNPRIPQPYKEASTTPFRNIEVKPGPNGIMLEVK